ncbi:MAG: hypothetical protein K6F99_03215, partial [Lachnospiraceae bacterium]|nr:hypothetical protein [Lachnospiraceae bacterium]
MSTISQISGINNLYNPEINNPEKKPLNKPEEKTAIDSNDIAAVFTKTSEEETDPTKQIYSVNKMSQEERDKLIQKLQAETDNRVNQLKSLVSKMFTDQAGASATAGDDEIWKVFANGDLSTVSEAAKAQAAEDISEDGYFGVKQTSERLFDYASALAGDDPDKMKDMQAAIEQGYKDATEAWGKDLPEISQKTLEATNSLFDDYY